MPLAPMLVLLAQAVITAPAPSQPNDVKQEIRPVVEYLRGEWIGAGNFVKSGKPLESTFQFQEALGGEALLVRHEEREPNKFAYNGLISLDTRAGRPVLMIASNKNGGARLFHSSGWDGKQLSFQSSPDLSTWFAHERITFTRGDESTFVAKYEMSRDNGVTWTVGDVQTFRRTSPRS